MDVSLKKCTEYMRNPGKILDDNIFSKIIKNSGIILSGNILSSALNLISFTIIAKQLGPELLAVLVLTQTYAIIINDVFNIQTWESMIKFGSAKLNNSKVTNVIKTNLLLDIISAIFAFLFAVLLIKPTIYILGWDSSNLNIFIEYSLTILFNITSFTIGVPRLFDKFLSIAKVQIAMSIIKLSLICWAIYYSNTLITYIHIFLLINILTNIVLIIYSAIILRHNYGNKWWAAPLKIDREQIKFIWWTNLRTIIRIPVQHFDMIVISSVISMHMVGIYKVYKEIAGFINRVGEPVNQAIFPEFTKLLGKAKTAQTSEIAKKTIFMLAIVGSVISLSMFIVSHFLVSTFFGTEYITDINVLYCMIVLFCFSFITVPVNSLFIAAGFAKYSFFIILFSNLAYLTASFGLGNLIGVYGIVIAYATQLFINKGLKIYYLGKYADDWQAIR